MPYNTDIEAMLDADVVALAATTFVAVFTGVGLGEETASGRVRKHLRATFGNPRWSAPDGRIYDAVALQTILLWERAGVAGRMLSGVLQLLPRGARLLDAPDPIAALRELL
ncbi:hypothetical protein EV646_111156 [Kribbella antiqua]|uniref:Uncharacterized protein n=1 Tax=Kribbella antiqua TaxID=2512217 RepID=A0A4R2IGR5_9ACTN|nr:hypothetical protein [Kribbella antiqua]TCO43964.1 hypothetical protein EV646_111156 [Kribbella antiqua]